MGQTWQNPLDKVSNLPRVPFPFRTARNPTGRETTMKKTTRTTVRARFFDGANKNTPKKQTARPARVAAQVRTRRAKPQHQFTRSELLELLGSITCGEVMKLNKAVEFVDANDKKVPPNTTLLEIGTF